MTFDLFLSISLFLDCLLWSWEFQRTPLGSLLWSQGPTNRLSSLVTICSRKLGSRLFLRKCDLEMVILTLRCSSAKSCGIYWNTGNCLISSACGAKLYGCFQPTCQPPQISPCMFAGDLRRAGFPHAGQSELKTSGDLSVRSSSSALVRPLVRTISELLVQMESCFKNYFELMDDLLWSLALKKNDLMIPT